MKPMRSRRGTVAMESAIVISLAMTVSLGTIQAGMMSWTKAGIQAAASITARCMALASTACTGIGGAQYAVNQSRRFVSSSAITTSNVTVTAADVCSGSVGHFTKVVITSNQWSVNSVMKPFTKKAITVTACYPSSST